VLLAFRKVDARVLCCCGTALRGKSAYPSNH
jgi:hypothetical protein